MSEKWVRKVDGNTLAIFIHGILSSGDTAWGKEAGHTWPDFLAQEKGLEALSVYNYSYLTSITSGSYSINDVVDHLKEIMQLDELNRYTNIIFVCHSMGGIVARKLVVSRAPDFIKRGQQIGFFLVASPSIGSGYADWLSAIIRLAGHKQADKLKFNRDSGWLNELDKEFRNLKGLGEIELFGKELSEHQPVTRKSIFFRPKPIVESHSSSRYFGESIKIPDSDHFSIAKPKTSEAFQHRLLCKFITDNFKLKQKNIFLTIFGNNSKVCHNTSEDGANSNNQGAETPQENTGSEKPREIGDGGPKAHSAKHSTHAQSSSDSTPFSLETTRGFDSIEVLASLKAFPTTLKDRLFEKLFSLELPGTLANEFATFSSEQALDKSQKLILALQKLTRSDFNQSVKLFSIQLKKYSETAHGWEDIRQSAAEVRQVFLWLLANGVSLMYREEKGGCIAIDNKQWCKQELLNHPASGEIIDWDLFLSHLLGVKPNWLEACQHNRETDLLPKGAKTTELLELGRNKNQLSADECLVALYDDIVRDQDADTLNSTKLTAKQERDLRGRIQAAPDLDDIHYFYFIFGAVEDLSDLDRDIVQNNHQVKSKLEGFLDVLHIPGGGNNYVLISEEIRSHLKSVYDILGPIPPFKRQRPPQPTSNQFQPPETEEGPHGELR